MPVLKEVEIKQRISMGKKAEYNDSPNLYLAATVACTGYWQVNRLVNGKRVRLNIGRYPELSSKDARRVAPVIYDALRDHDPKHLKSVCAMTTDPERIRSFLYGETATVKRVAPSFENYAREWWKSTIEPSTLDPKTIRQKIQQLESYAFPVIGSKPINQINYEEIRLLIQPMWSREGKRGGEDAGNETARRLLGIIREIFRVAINDRANSLVEINPTPTARDFPKYNKNPDHYRSLPYEDAHKFWNWLMDESPATAVTKAATAMVMLLGKRQKEVRHFKWSFVDFEKLTITVPGEFVDPKAGRRVRFTKNGQPASTPIPTKLASIMADIKEITSANVYAFSLHPTNPLSENTISKCIEGFEWRDENDRPLNVHGLRGTVAQWLEDVVQPREGILKKLLLQHTLEDLELAYSVRPELRMPVEAERRQIMQRWEDYVTKGLV